MPLPGFKHDSEAVITGSGATQTQKLRLGEVERKQKLSMTRKVGLAYPNIDKFDCKHNAVPIPSQICRLA